jgi:hypothetical protein
MMRRIVDASIPAGCAIAVAPAATHIQELPPSLHAVLGPALGLAWAITLGVACLAVLVGICLRKTHPAAAFRFEFGALGYAAFISSMYGTTILIRTGLTTWTAAAFVYTLGAHFMARFFELMVARKSVPRIGP